ncbi:MAG TPA: aquaporin Z [Leptolyngbyaceae cyanobacterium M33_DOE_097]|uniref:Aquaporin Z n=1 Tax=Oscillatoriales cyanobacterium SpSt-418 TaxID=2282169 RepID=A0A7C3PK62_9CYAN|nr:aquaporin Z [Leptolyngbyaceae cyanobacterium M33_DOE_097]
MPLNKKLLAEFLGTLWLVLGGCGSAVLAAKFPYSADPTGASNFFGLGFLGVSLAFGLTVLTGAYALGHFSGGHFNPAVSFGLWAAKRFRTSELLPYIIAQVLGAVAGAVIIYLINPGALGFTGAPPAGLFATNGFGELSPGKFTLASCFVAEFVLTFFFLLVILGVTDIRAPKGFAPAAIGLALTLIHLISIPVTNTSVNPARSTGVALLAGLPYISQLWFFWIVPILGALLAGWLYYNFFEPTHEEREQIAAEAAAAARADY